MTPNRRNEIKKALDILQKVELGEILEVFASIMNPTSQSVPAVQHKEVTDYEKVTKLIHEIGVPAHIKGYQYLREAIVLVLKDSKYLEDGITKVLYPEIAKKFGSTSGRVERAIRHAKEIAWERGNMKLLKEIFNNGEVANNETIAGLAEYVRMYMR